jgi:hypothetical protein
MGAGKKAAAPAITALPTLIKWETGTGGLSAVTQFGS